MAKNQINIKAELKARKITQTSIAEMLRVSPVSVHDVIAGKKTSARIKRAVAFAIGRPISEIWPE